MKALINWVALALMGGGMAFAQLPKLNPPELLRIAQRDDGHGERGGMHHGGRWHGHRHHHHRHG